MSKSTKSRLDPASRSRGNGSGRDSLRALVHKGLIVTPEGDVVLGIPDLADRLSAENGLLARLARLRAAGRLPTTKKK